MKKAGGKPFIYYLYNRASAAGPGRLAAQHRNRTRQTIFTNEGTECKTKHPQRIIGTRKDSSHAPKIGHAANQNNEEQRNKHNKTKQHEAKQSEAMHCRANSFTAKQCRIEQTHAG